MYSIKKKQQTTPVKEQNCGCRDRSTRLRCSLVGLRCHTDGTGSPTEGLPAASCTATVGFGKLKALGRAQHAPGLTQPRLHGGGFGQLSSSQEDRSLRRASSSQHTATTGLLGTSLNKTPNFLQQEPICSSKTTAGLSMVGTEEPAPCLTVAAPVGQDAAPAHEGPPSVPT